MLLLLVFKTLKEMLLLPLLSSKVKRKGLGAKVSADLDFMVGARVLAFSITCVSGAVCSQTTPNKFSCKY